MTIEPDRCDESDGTGTCKTATGSIPRRQQRIRFYGRAMSCPIVVLPIKGQRVIACLDRVDAVELDRAIRVNVKAIRVVERSWHMHCHPYGVITAGRVVLCWASSNSNV